MQDRSRITKAQIESYEVLWSHLISLYKDVESLAKRKQDGLMSKTRVATVNSLLREILVFLVGQQSLKFLALLDEETLPQNADALIFLGQYKSAMQNFKRVNTHMDHYELKWKNTDRTADEE
jgi:hypothetical protein